MPLLSVPSNPTLLISRTEPRETKQLILDSRYSILAIIHWTTQDKHAGKGTSFGWQSLDVVLWARYEHILSRDFLNPSNTSTMTPSQACDRTLQQQWSSWSDVGKIRDGAGSRLRRSTVAASLQLYCNHYKIWVSYQARNSNSVRALCHRAENLTKTP